MALGADLGIETANELKSRLQPLLAEPGAVVLDGAEVRRVHTASLQVLAAFVREREAAGHATELSDCAPALKEAAQILGLSPALGLPVDK